MKKYFLLSLSAICLLFVSNAEAANNLTVQNVQTRQSDRGSIDSAVLTVKPVGAYFEYGLYLNLSSKSTVLNKITDSLEIVLTFDLNANAMMIDSWLWVEDTIVKAMLIDKGQAQQIYEGIVKRRKDPSILYKLSQTSYEFRIYPLVGSSHRRVKISWLQPATWSAKTVSAPLPTNLMQLSKTLLSKFKVIALTDPTWSDPSLSVAGYTFTDIDDQLYGKGKEVNISSANYSIMPSIQYPSPMQNGFYLQCYADAPDEGYYQLIMLTKQAIDLTTKKKSLFIVDYDANQSNLSRQDVLSELKIAIMDNYSAKDSFNILLSNTNPQPVSEKWISASSDNIKATFEAIKEEQLSVYSYLQLSLPAGLKYVKNSERGANVVVVSNSDGLGNYKVANPLITEITAISDITPQINCLDYSTTRRIYNQNSTNYLGNFYLYDYLTKWSGGYYLDANKPAIPLSTAVTSIINSTDGKVQSLELYTTLEDGFCYGRYDLSASQAQKDAGIVFQIGRYYGKLPVMVRATGFYQDKPFSKEVKFDVAPEVDSTRMTRRIWNGNYISSLEKGTVTNDVIKEIVDVSRRNRVLSLYTAFLALEPWLMPKGEYIFYDPKSDNNQTTEVDEPVVIQKDIVQIRAYPNPFTTSLDIELNQLLQGVNISSVEIYNALGNVVKTFGSDAFSGDKGLVWLGDDNSGSLLPGGMYVIVIKTSMGPVRFNVMLSR